MICATPSFLSGIPVKVLLMEGTSTVLLITLTLYMALVQLYHTSGFFLPFYKEYAQFYATQAKK
jgi:hypothetical protein